jgi:hypothetical protein
MSVTLPVSQFVKSWLNSVATKNIRFILVTLLVSHEFKGELKFRQFEKHELRDVLDNIVGTSVAKKLYSEVKLEN